MVLTAHTHDTQYDIIEGDSNADNTIESQEPGQLDLFSGDVSNVIKQNKSKVDKINQPPRLQEVPVQENIPLTDQEFFLNLNENYEHLFTDVDITSVKYDKTNSTMEFVSQGLEFRVEFQWRNVQYFVQNTKFNASDLVRFSFSFSLLFAKICTHFWFDNKQMHHVKKWNNSSVKKYNELPEPQDRIFLAKTTVDKQNIHYLKYNGNIEKNKASLHIKIWSDVYRITNISYTIHAKDPRDIESEIAISINNPNNLNIKKFNKNKWWFDVNSPEMINWLKDLSYHVLLNHNPHIV